MCLQIIHIWYIHKQLKVFGNPQKCVFPILKGLLVTKQVKHHNDFIYYTKCKSFSASLTLI